MPGSVLVSSPSRPRQDLPGRLPREIDRVRANLFHDRRPIAPQPRQLTLRNLGDTGMVAAPAANTLRQALDLPPPISIFGVYACGSDDEEVDVAGQITVPSGRAAVERSVHSRDPPRPYRRSQPADQLHAGFRHSFDGRREQVISIEEVEERPARLHPLDQTVGNQAIEDVLDAGVGAPTQPRQLTPGARSRGPCERDENVDIHAVRKCRRGPSNIHNVLSIDHVIYI
jgi:hypothetical protein